MKTLIKAAVAATVATGLFASPALAANTATAPFTAKAKIVKPLTLTAAGTLDFATILIPASGVTATRFRFVRHNAANETVACALGDEGPTFDRLAAKSAALGAPLTPDGGWVRVGL